MLQLDFSGVKTGVVFSDERQRLMRFPSRQDYLEFLVAERLITRESDFSNRSDLVQGVYLDWLRRGQVGCIFAQLLGRARNRVGLRTVVVPDCSRTQAQVRDLADAIDQLIKGAAEDREIEAITILLPAIVSPEDLVKLLLALSRLVGWKIEIEREWRTLTIVGLRTVIGPRVWTEILGLGPMAFLPPTRQSPVTSLEVRTKDKGSIWSRITRTMRAAHLAYLPTDRFLTPQQHRTRFKTLTPALKKRILGGNEDERAKARVTFAVPSAMWNTMKSSQL